MQKHKIILGALGITIAASGVSVTSVNAQTQTSIREKTGISAVNKAHLAENRVGEIMSISGNSIQVKVIKGKNGFKTYTVNAANAVVKKITFIAASANSKEKISITDSSLSDLIVGQKIRIKGEINVAASTIAAKEIMEIPESGARRPSEKIHSAIGIVETVSGTAVTIKNTNGEIINIDISKALLKNRKSVATAADIKAGMRIAISGTEVSNNSIVAKTVLLNVTSLNSKKVFVHKRFKSPSEGKRGLTKRMENSKNETDSAKSAR